MNRSTPYCYKYLAKKDSYYPLCSYDLYGLVFIDVIITMIFLGVCLLKKVDNSLEYSCLRLLEEEEEEGGLKRSKDRELLGILIVDR